MPPAKKAESHVEMQEKRLLKLWEEQDIGQR